MLVLSMRSPTPSPTRQPRVLSPPQSSARPESPETAHLRKQVAGAMLSVLPSSRPLRPKLSLQTTLPPPSSIKPNLDLLTNAASPTVRNTFANTFDVPPPTPASAVRPQVDFPPSHDIPTSTTPRPSNLAAIRQDAPYILPLGARSILRNSPLPKRHLSATTSSRPHRRMFFPIKRVTFKESLAENAPQPITERSDDESVEQDINEEEREERRATIEAEDGHSSRRTKRSKRGRDWVWRPMPEDIPIPRLEEVTSPVRPPQSKVEIPSVESSSGHE